MASRTIFRSKSRDRWTPSRIEYGQSTHRLDQEARDPGRQHHTTASPTPSLDLLPEGCDGHYDARHERNGRENHAQIQPKNLDETKQNHDGDEERARNSNRTQSQDD